MRQPRPRESVHGASCFPTLSDLPSAPDAVVVAVPAAKVPAVIDEAGALGCGGAVVFAAGFRESLARRSTADLSAASSSAGAALEADLRAAALRHSLPVCGPNCDGLVALHSRAALWGDALGPVEPGHVGLVSQSGNLVVNALGTRRGLRLHTAISSGNETVLSTADWVAHLATEPELRSIALMIEHAGDGAALCEALAACADAGVGVAVLKVGASAVGAAAAAAHTGALAGDHRVFRALVDEAGAAWAEDVHDLLELAKALAVRGARPRGRGLGILTCSGGDSGLGADEAERLGIELPAFAPGTEAALEERLPAAATIANPLDYTALIWGDREWQAEHGRARRRGPRRRPGARLLRPPARARRRLRRELAGGRGRHPRRRPRQPRPGPRRRHPPRAARRHGRLALRRGRSPRDRGPPHRPRLRRRAPGPTARRRAAARDGRRRPPNRPRPPFGRHQPGGRDLRNGAPSGPRQPTALRRAAAGSPSTKPKTSSGAAQVPVVDGRIVAGEDDAVAALAELGGPVAVKASSPDLQHKAAIGALALDVAAEADVRSAWRSLATNGAVLVERMADPGVELIVSVRRDAVVPALVIGLGGSLTEVLDDVVVIPLPATPDRIEGAVRRLKGAKLLAGADLPAAARLASRLTELPGLELVECNPVLVHNEGAVVVDAVAKEISA